jgi:hypothetical protein
MTARPGILALLALAGCAAPEPEAEPYVPVINEREAIVQTIPRGGYVELNGGYIGVAPVTVKVRTREDGHPTRLNVIEATDTASGAWERKAFTSLHPFPDKILFDLRPWLSPSPPGS